MHFTIHLQMEVVCKTFQCKYNIEGNISGFVFCGLLQCAQT